MSTAAAARLNLVLSFIGLFVAGMLSMSHGLNIVLPCGVSAGCDLVTQDPRSNILGIPIAYIGLAAYTVMAILTGMRLFASEAKAARLHKLGYLFSGIGLLTSIGLTFFSIRVIHAVCTWCIASAITMSLLFGIHAWGAARSKRDTIRKGAFDVALIWALVWMVGAGLVFSALDLKLKENELTVANTGALDAVSEEDFLPLDAHADGAPSATSSVVMFGDLTCPACQRAYGRIRTMMERRKDFRLVFRHLPLEFHPMARPAAILSELAAEKGKFWDYVTELYSSSPNSVEEMMSIAESMGVDRSTMEKRLHDGNDPAAKLVQRDEQRAAALGLHSTPSLFVTAPGFYPEPASTNTIEAMLGDIERKRKKSKRPQTGRRSERRL